LTKTGRQDGIFHDQKLPNGDYFAYPPKFLSHSSIEDLHCGLIAEGDKVCAIGRWRVMGLPDDESGKGKLWDWVQLFRAEEGRLIEIWLS
jgi:hypothetical protein